MESFGHIDGCFRSENFATNVAIICTFWENVINLHTKCVEMCRTMPYVIPFKGLKEGDYEFDFKVGDSLFESYSRAEILGGDCTAHIDMHRSETMLEIHASIAGSVVCQCDRCLEDCDVPVSFEGDLLVRFSDRTDDYDGEVMWISPAEDSVDLTQYIYESIVLSLPYRRVHPEGECDPDMLARFGVMSAEEFDRRAAEAENADNCGIGEEAAARLAELKSRMESQSGADEQSES